MPKFSIIVPVYNVEQYIDKCLKSTEEQVFMDFEVIIINDGTKDNSQLIIDKYVQRNNNFKSFIKENGGLSDARNYGVEKATGDYLIFIDSDDYVDNNMLLLINETIEKNNDVDLIKFNYALNIDGKIIEMPDNKSFENISGSEAIQVFINEKRPFVMAWLFAYNRNFYNSNKFKYAKGKVHEDFGLTPIIILKANKVISINDTLYFYSQNNESITRTTNIEKNIKKAYDVLYHYDYLKDEVKKINIENRDLNQLIMSYLANSLMGKAKELSGINRDKFLFEIKKRRIYNDLVSDTLIRKIKKIILKIFPKLYLKVMV